MRMHPSVSIVLNILILEGCGLLSPPEEKVLTEPLIAPQELVVEGFRFYAGGSLSYNRMPGAVHSSGLQIAANLTDTDHKNIRNRFSITNLWIVQGDQKWKYQITQSERTRSAPWSRSVGRNHGPPLAYNSLADVIIKVHVADKPIVFYLRAPDVKVLITIIQP